MKVIVVIVGAIILLGALAYGIMPTMQDLQTEDINQDINVATGVGVTTASVTLGSTLWNDSTSYLSLASNVSSDVPVAVSYNATSKVLAIDGLSDNITRVLTVSYESSSLDDYQGIEQATNTLPVALVISVIAICLGAAVMAFIRR